MSFILAVDVADCDYTISRAECTFIMPLKAVRTGFLRFFFFVVCFFLVFLVIVVAKMLHLAAFFFSSSQFAIAIFQKTT